MSNTDKSHHHYPPLLRISHIEAESIHAMFKLYDINSSGRIPQRLVVKLLGCLGFGPISAKVTVPDMNIKEFLLFLDYHIPEATNPLSTPMYTFTNLVSHPAPQSFGSTSDEVVSNVITPKDLAEFMESIGRPPVLLENANLLLSSMLDYDDCSAVPAVRADFFERDVTIFAKKNNLLKELK